MIDIQLTEGGPCSIYRENICYTWNIWSLKILAKFSNQIKKVKLFKIQYICLRKPSNKQIEKGRKFPKESQQWKV